MGLSQDNTSVEEGCQFMECDFLTSSMAFYVRLKLVFHFVTLEGRVERCALKMKCWGVSRNSEKCKKKYFPLEFYVIFTAYSQRVVPEQLQLLTKYSSHVVF